MGGMVAQHHLLGESIMAKVAEMNIGQMAFVKVRSVTRPVLAIDGSKPVYFKVTGVIHEAPLAEGQKRKKSADGQEMKSPDIMHVVNLETGEDSTIVANSVLKSELQSTYPNDAYVNKCFAVEKTGTKRSANGTNYSTFQISEIEIKQAEQAPEAAKPAVKK
jgi:hypothetical protein